MGPSMSPPAPTAIVRHGLVALDPGSGPFRDGLSRAGARQQSEIQDPPAAWPVAPEAPYRWTEAMSFERMWAELVPVGRSVRTGGYFRQPYEAAEVELRHWFVGEAEARGLRVERDGVGNVIAWWDAGTPGTGRRHRVAPGLGARRRGVRRAARRRLRAGGGRPAARARRGAVASRRGLGVRRGGGLALRAGLPRLAAGRRSRDLGDGPRAAGPRRRRPPGRARARRAWTPARTGPPPTSPTGWRASSSCTWSRAATSSTAAPRWAWPARSGRTGATGSSSPARRTTPAPPGWRTGTTRCCPTR